MHCASNEKQHALYRQGAWDAKLRSTSAASHSWFMAKQFAPVHLVPSMQAHEARPSSKPVSAVTQQNWLEGVTVLEERLGGASYIQG